MKAGCIVLATLALCACVHDEPKSKPSKPTARIDQIVGPDGQPAMAISCGRVQYCYKAAGEQCPNGYDTVDFARGMHKGLMIRCH